MTLKQTIEKLEALDKARTQGEWYRQRSSVLYSYGVCSIKSVSHHAQTDEKGDANFIAAAPEMMEVIRKQRELLEMAKATLEVLKNHSLCESSRGAVGRTLTKLQEEMGGA